MSHRNSYFDTNPTLKDFLHMLHLDIFLHGRLRADYLYIIGRLRDSGKTEDLIFMQKLNPRFNKESYIERGKSIYIKWQ